MLSSTAPLQSSSMLLQTSAAGEPGVQVWGTPATQLLTVRWQAPVPHVVLPGIHRPGVAVVVDAVAHLDGSRVDGRVLVVAVVEERVAVMIAVLAQVTGAVAVRVGLVGIATDGQLSQASPTPSRSWSVWERLATSGQLSSTFKTVSPSLSSGTIEQGFGLGTSQAPGGAVEPRHPSAHELTPSTR